MYLYEVRAVQLIVDKMQGLYSSGTDMLSVAQRDVVIHPVEHLKISPIPSSCGSYEACAGLPRCVRQFLPQ